MSIRPYFKESYMPSKDEVQDAIVRRAITRNIFPYRQTLRWFDKRKEYYEEIQDFVSAYTYELEATPDSNEQLKEHVVKVPLIHRKMSFKPGEFERINDSPLPVAERLRRMVERFCEDEERILFGAQCPDTQVYGISGDTTNHCTNVTTELNVTSITNIITTLVKQIQELASDPTSATTGINYTYGTDPLVLCLDTDTYNTAMSTASTADGKQEVHTVMDMIKKILAQYGGPGSGVFHTPWLTATITKDNVDKWTPTAASRESILFPYNPKHLYVDTSPIHSLPKDDPHEGYSKIYAYRLRLVVVQPYAVRYGDAPVIA